MASSHGCLSGKVALVTGSTTGIGEAIASRFAAEGARVMVHGRRMGEAERVVRVIGGDERRGVDYVLADLEDPTSAESLVAATVSRFGGLDVLVNNAALMTRGDLEATDSRTFDRTIAVNLRAPLLLARAALRVFRDQGGGVILNIGSVNGYCGERGQLAYAVSKGGLMTLSRNLADAHGRENVRVYHLNVGWVLTPGEYELKVREGLPPQWPSSIEPRFAPSGRLLSPETIAHFALAFVDPGAGAVSGAVVDLEQYPVIGRNPSKEVAGGRRDPA
ncbi:MAG: SDR family NAD(P)-dependent oxidoreductase [Actinomycetota bacterium]|nr:SDR family NAD(P)-dependent oxidoreductase [Actinomycetota bacterium]